MNKKSAAIFVTLIIGCLVSFSNLLMAEEKKADESSTHSHSHSSHGKNDVYNGIFEDDQIKPRSLEDWQGDWQSIYPYLVDGTFDPVMAHKAESGKKTAEEYRAYYEIGYKTDVERIVINGNEFAFYKNGKATTANYESDGFEVLTYKSGKRGVRYIFKKTNGDSLAPKYVQFSDHIIAPQKAGHYHLYWGDDRAKLLKEVTNWPTYYPASLSGNQIVEEMLAH